MVKYTKGQTVGVVSFGRIKNVANNMNKCIIGFEMPFGNRTYLTMPHKRESLNLVGPYRE